MWTERRRHPRVPSRQRCWCEGDDITIYAQIGDLSEGGLSLRTSAPLAPGSPLRVRLPGADGPLELRARVAWCAERATGGQPGLGLCFEGASRGALEQLRGMVRSLERARP
jgi:uncharacterized protein (TIGR02266 family)